MTQKQLYRKITLLSESFIHGFIKDCADMGRLKILAAGSSSTVRAQARGALFDAMMTQALHHYGYRIERTLRVHSGGMGMDVEGRHRVTGLPCYAECIFSETRIPATELQAFYGKFMTRWHKDKNCRGLFIALPGIDSDAYKFYREYIKGNPEVFTRLYEEDEVFKAITKAPGVAGPKACARTITRDMGTPGKCVLCCTDKGLFWAQHITSSGKEPQNRLVLFDARGHPLSDPSIIKYLTQLYPEQDAFKTMAVAGHVAFQPGLFQDTEDIVEVRGGSEFFEYRRPASAEHFVGKPPLFETIDAFVDRVVHKQTTLRGLVFEAPSGWGKSSAILACVSHLRAKGHFAVAIDARTASSVQFISQAVHYTLKKFGDFHGRIMDPDPKKTYPGFENTVKAMLTVGNILEGHGKLLLVFFDQLEAVFTVPDVQHRIRRLFLEVCGAQSNIVFGFAWRKDLIGLTHVFSKDLRADILSSSEPVGLKRFSAVETDEFLDRLRDVHQETLHKDLRLLIAEVSQGYPWLLKTLCAQVNARLSAATPQLDIARHLSGIETLFQNELQGLAVEAKTALQDMAGAVPIYVPESGEIYSPEIVQALLRRGVLARIGDYLDIYGDLFRDYLIDGSVPPQENYILRTKAEEVLAAIRQIRPGGDSMNLSELQHRLDLAEKSFYHLLRDLELLGLVKVENGRAVLQIKLPLERKPLELSMRRYLHGRFQEHPLIQQILAALKEKDSLSTYQLAGVFKGCFTYVPATRQTWISSANILAGWMDTVDLAFWDRENRRLIYFDPETDIRERRLFLPKRRGAKTPRIQYSPVARIADRLAGALRGDGRVDWAGFSKHTIFRVLAVLEDLGFIARRSTLIRILPKGQAFLFNPEKRSRLFAEAALKMTSFSIFTHILNSRQDVGGTLFDLGFELQKKLGKTWKQSTAETTAKIMLDWARHGKLAPGVFAETRKGPIKGWKAKDDRQLSLF